MRTWETKLGTRVIRLNNLRCNCYFIIKDTAAVLVDTSVKAERFIIERAMKKLGLEKPNAVILTHNHFDHVGNAELFRSNYSCDVIIHEADHNGLASGCTDLPDGMSQPFKAFTKYINSREIILPFQRFTPCTEAIPARSGQGLDKYGINAVLLSTPGHTDGSVSIIVDNEIAIVGDCMVHKRRGEIFPPFAKHPDEVSGSWAKLADTGCRLFLPAHGNEIPSELVKARL